MTRSDRRLLAWVALTAAAVAALGAALQAVYTRDPHLLTAAGLIALSGAGLAWCIDHADRIRAHVKTIIPIRRTHKEDQ